MGEIIMDGKKIFDLAVELIDRMEVASKEAAMVKIEMGNEDLFFVHDGDDEYVNPKHLPLSKHFQIKQLSDFIRYYRDINEDSLKMILSMNKTKFQFLIEVQETVPNLIQEVRATEDDRVISYLYAVNKMYPHKKEDGVSL